MAALMAEVDSHENEMLMPHIRLVVPSEALGEPSRAMADRGPPERSKRSVHDST
jgi:hypothetical protein